MDGPGLNGINYIEKTGLKDMRNGTMKSTKQLYHKLVKRGIINKDIQMKEVKKIFHDVSKYNAKEDLKKIYEKK
jgi:hypothetical protein